MAPHDSVVILLQIFYHLYLLNKCRELSYAQRSNNLLQPMPQSLFNLPTLPILRYGLSVEPSQVFKPGSICSHRNTSLLQPEEFSFLGKPCTVREILLQESLSKASPSDGLSFGFHHPLGTSPPELSFSRQKVSGKIQLLIFKARSDFKDLLNIPDPLICLVRGGALNELRRIVLQKINQFQLSLWLTRRRGVSCPHGIPLMHHRLLILSHQILLLNGSSHHLHCSSYLTQLKRR